MTRFWVVPFLFFLSAAFAQHEHHAAPVGRLGVLGLDVYRDGGTLHLLTGRVDGEGATPSLWYQRSADAGETWTPAVRIPADPPPYRMERGDDPQVAADGERILAAWTAAGTGWGGSGPLTTAMSSDGGRTWQRGGNPADDRNKEGHAFIDLAVQGGAFHAVWLDERGKVYGLRYSRSTDGRLWSANETLQRQSCECCWNTLLSAPDGRLFALYRNGKPRDMALALRAADGRWSDVGAVGAFNWQIDACPHAGGGLALAGGRVHGVVWTGEEKNAGLYYMASENGGRAWQAARRIGGADAMHADIAASGARIMLAWDEGEKVYAMSSNDAGGTWETPRQVSARPATHPRVVSTADGFLVLWTERSAAGRWEWRQVRSAQPREGSFEDGKNGKENKK